MAAILIYSFYHFRKGDCLLSVNGVELKDFTLLDAYELFRTLPPGPVHVIAIRDMGHTTV